MNTSPLRSTTSRLPKVRQQPASPSQIRPKTSQSLHLPGLPRFHPANYPSAARGGQPHPTDSPSTTTIAIPPPSDGSIPRQHQQQYYRQYQYNYHGLSPLSTSSSSLDLGSGKPRLSRPTSPRLNPLGSPGPVTPLALEDADGGRSGYMDVVVRSASHTSLGELAGTEESREFLVGLGEKERVRGGSRPGTPARA